jgi:hypothetical protein
VLIAVKNFDGFALIGLAIIFMNFAFHAYFESEIDEIRAGMFTF